MAFAATRVIIVEQFGFEIMPDIVVCEIRLPL